MSASESQLSSYDALSGSIINGDVEQACSLVQQLLASGAPADRILDRGLIPGIRRVGELFESGEFFLPELLLGGEATLQALQVLEPLLAGAGGPKRGRYLIGTVKDDVHDIGKNIIIMMLRGSGWQVTDLGTDVAPERFVEEVRKGQYDILGLSALLTMTMPGIVATIDALRAAGLRDRIKVMVGGAPVTKEWADAVGADGYAADAPGAIKVAAGLSRQGGAL